jgi:NitT/TauT family transport system permease protein
LLLLPFFLVWLGFGLLPKVLLVISVIVVIVALAVASGVREVDTSYIDNVRVLGGGKPRLILDVYAPSVALWVLSSSRTTVGYALQAAVAAEFIGSNVGLGALVVKGQGFLDVSQVFAAIAVMLVLAVILDLALSLVQRRVTRWMR